MDRDPAMRAGRGQHEQRGRRALLSSSRSSPSISTSSLPERGISASSLPVRGISGSSSLCQLSQRATRDDGTQFSLFPGHEPRVESGYSSLEKTAPDSRQPSLSLFSDENTPRRLQVTGQFEGDHREYVDNSSSSELSSSSSFSNATQHVRHNRLHFSKKEEQSLGSALQQASPGVPRSALPRYRPSKSLDRRAAEATTTPDLLNFKKGWMTRLDDDGQWKKYWFVLTDLILRFYRNSMAEEAADMDGEMNLSTCYDITDFPVQKNYGFQIHTKDGVYTLCAMTAAIRRNWVQAVMKNVRPTAAPDVTRSLPDQKAPQGQQRPDPIDPHPLERQLGKLGKLEQQKSDIRELCLEPRYNTFDWPEFNCKEEEEGGWDTADGSSASPISSPVSSSIASSSSYQCLRDTALQEDEGLEKGRGLCLQAPHMTRPSETTTAGTPKDRSEKGLEVDSSTSASDLRADAADMQVKVEQQQVENTSEREERQVPTSTISELAEERERLSSEQHTVKLVRELEQTQRELSRLKQINNSLQYQLEQESEHNSREGHQQNCLLPSTDSFSSDEASAWQRLQKRNEDLCSELDAQRRSQKEVELQRRVEVLALQAQVLRAGEAAVLASPKLGQEQQHCQEQQEEWDRCMASMQAQLSDSEERRREAEFGLRQEVSRHVLQQETERLRMRLQEVSARLSANEEVQAQKEERLQKHLGLLQDSQDRERRSLAASLAQAERQVQVLQEQLQKAKQHQESVRTGETWTSGVEEAQKQLQDELACTVAAVMTLQEEREQLERRCQELQNQLAEADGEVSRMQSRLQTEETDYYNLEHSYERVCEELQRALGQAQDREAAARDAQEGYERLLDRKEQDLSEALVKMSALGSSLEETELKLSEAKGGCTCSSCPPERTYDESIQREDMGQQRTVGTLFKVTDNRLKIKSSNLHLVETQTLFNSNGAATNCSISEMGYSRPRSRSVDPAYQYIVTEGDDPDRFMSIIQVLENKLYVTEEKLRDITERLEEPPGDIPQRLEEPQGQLSGADPHVRSQLNQSRARAQQLSLLLHNQAKQSQRFALETESHTRVLSDQFQAALASIEACRERLQPLLQNPGAGTANIDASLCSLEMQLATAAACLMKGGKAAEEQRFACLQAQREEEIVVDKTLPEVKVENTGRCMCTKMLSLEEGGVGTFGRVLALEASILEKMASALQSRDYTPGKSDSHLGGDEGDVVRMYVKVLSKRMAMEVEERTQDGKQSGSSTEFEMSVIGRVCARAELAYIALTLQRRYEGELQGDLHSDDTTREHLWQGSKPEEQCGASNKLSSSQSRSLADVSPPELAPYEEQVQPKTRGLKEEMLERNLEGNPFAWGTDNSEKQDWIEKLAAQLQRKAMVLRTVCHKIPNSIGSEESREGHPWLDVSDSAMTVYPLWELLAQAQVTYVAYRLQLDYEQKLQTCKVQLDSLQALCHEQEATLSKERLTLSHNLSHLQEDSDTLRERLEWAEQTRVTTETETQQKVEVLLADIDNIEYRHEQQVQKLEEKFQGKMMELQQIHEKEMEHLHCLYACSSSVAMDAQTTSHPLTTSPPETTTIDSALQADGPRKNLMSTAIHMLETQVNTTKEELGSQHLEGDALAMREAYQRDLKNLKASCERGFNAMKEVHQKLVGDLQRQHQREVTTLMQEKDRLLEEETVATVAAIEAMRKAHNEELEKSKHLQLSGVSPDITVLRSKYEDDLQSLHRELEVLSGQYSQKCLESSHVDQAREAERQARLQCQREIQELNTQKQELTHRLTEEISRMCSCLNGELADTGLQEKDLYELEVILRVRDTELHCLRQETHSLKEELKAALRDKAYATDNLKALSAELNISQEKAQYDITELREELCAAIGASRDEGCGSSTGVQGNGIVQSKSNPDFLKGRTTLTRQIRGLRSRSLKEGLSVQERMKLFDSLDSQKN